MNASTAWLLAGALVVVLSATARLLWVALRRRPVLPQPQASAPLVCPTCRRAYARGNQFCPIDAARLIPAQQSVPSLPPGRGGKCPRCRRAFEVGVRFCPMDAEELVPLAAWPQQHAEGAGAAGGIQTEACADYLVGGSGKICPVCASKYDLAAGYCGRDASELVTVN